MSKTNYFRASTALLARRGRLVKAVLAFAATVGCVTAIGTAVGALLGSVAVGAVVGIIWGLVFSLVWVLPVFLLKPRKKNEGHVRDPGYYGGGEGGGGIGL